MNIYIFRGQCEYIYFQSSICIYIFSEVNMNIYNFRGQYEYIYIIYIYI